MQTALCSSPGGRSDAFHRRDPQQHQHHHLRLAASAGQHQSGVDYPYSSGCLMVRVLSGAHVLRGGGLHDRSADGSGCPGAPHREVHDAAQPGLGQHHPTGH